MMVSFCFYCLYYIFQLQSEATCRKLSSNLPANAG